MLIIVLFSTSASADLSVLSGRSYTTADMVKTQTTLLLDLGPEPAKALVNGIPLTINLNVLLVKESVWPWRISAAELDQRPSLATLRGDASAHVDPWELGAHVCYVLCKLRLQHRLQNLLQACRRQFHGLRQARDACPLQGRARLPQRQATSPSSASIFAW